MGATVTEATGTDWPAILTWRGCDVPRMESARVAFSGPRLRANGTIVAAATDTSEAFAASYDLTTDAEGCTKRLSVTVTLAARGRQLSAARDAEGMWLVQDHRGQSRGAFDGACDVDMVFSPFFNALPIRRLNLHRGGEPVTVPVLYVTLPDFAVQAATVEYRPGVDGTVEVRSPFGDTEVTVDEAGFIVGYPGLAERL